jgi:ParB family chromosome partitioning protein
MKRKVLGKGLDALLSAPYEAISEDYMELDIDQIYPSEFQPREAFDDEKLEGLAKSILENGLIQPIIVRRAEKGYQIVAGERRWRAAQKANLQRIPAIVRDFSDVRAVEIALIENIQREQLNPVEEAKAYDFLTTEFHLSQEDVARKVGKDRSSVANYLRLLKLPAVIQKDIADDKISMGHARALLSVENEKLQLRLAEKVKAGKMSVRGLEAFIRDHKQKTQEVAAESEKKDVFDRTAEERLCKRFSTKVRIKKVGNQGKIEINFYSDEDLQRVFDLLMGNTA